PPLVGKAVAPRTEGGRGKGERGRDGLQALAFADLAHGLGPAADAGFPGLLDEGIAGRQSVMGKGQFAGPPLRGSSHTLRQTYAHLPSHDGVTLLSAQTLSDSNFPEAA